MLEKELTFSGLLCKPRQPLAETQAGGAPAAPTAADRWAGCIHRGTAAPLLDAAVTRAKPSWTQIIWSTIQRGGGGCVCVGGWADKTNPRKLLAAG